MMTVLIVDRNEAFSALIAANLDKIADAQRQRRKLQLSDKAICRQSADFDSAVRLARTFAKEGETQLLARMVDFFITLSADPPPPAPPGEQKP
jgi:hypothetical protein